MEIAVREKAEPFAPVIALLFLFAYCPGIITWLPDLLSKVA